MLDSPIERSYFAVGNMKAKNFVYDGEALTFDIVNEDNQVIMRHGIGSPVDRLPDEPTQLDLERIVELELRRARDTIELQKRRESKLERVKSLRLPDEIGISGIPEPPFAIRISKSGPPFAITGKVSQWTVEVEIAGPGDFFETAYPDEKGVFSFNVQETGDYAIVARNRVGESSEPVEIVVASKRTTTKA